MEIESLITLF